MEIVSRQIETHRSTYIPGEVRDIIDLSFEKQKNASQDADCFTGDVTRTPILKILYNSRMFPRWLEPNIGIVNSMLETVSFFSFFVVL